MPILGRNPDGTFSRASDGTVVPCGCCGGGPCPGCADCVNGRPQTICLALPPAPDLATCVLPNGVTVVRTLLNTQYTLGCSATVCSWVGGAIATGNYPGIEITQPPLAPAFFNIGFRVFRVGPSTFRLIGSTALGTTSLYYFDGTFAWACDGAASVTNALPPCGTAYNPGLPQFGFGAGFSVFAPPLPTSAQVARDCRCNCWWVYKSVANCTAVPPVWGAPTFDHSELIVGDPVACPGGAPPNVCDTGWLSQGDPCTLWRKIRSAGAPTGLPCDGPPCAPPTGGTISPPTTTAGLCCGACPPDCATCFESYRVVIRFGANTYQYCYRSQFGLGFCVWREEQGRGFIRCLDVGGGVRRWQLTFAPGANPQAGECDFEYRAVARHPTANICPPTQLAQWFKQSQGTACGSDPNHVTMTAFTAPCPAGFAGGPALTGDAMLDAMGYDPDTSPQSPKFGSCCDPPK